LAAPPVAPPEDDFLVDLDNNTVRCPAGVLVRSKVAIQGPGEADPHLKTVMDAASATT